MSKDKQKDPAFLMYSKDWLEGTGDLMPDEKGVYIDLLCYQHQRDVLPADTARLARLVGLPEDKFLKIWEHLKKKFVPANGSSLVNQKLTNVVAERIEFSMVKKVAGEFAYLLRESGYSDEKKEKIKKAFKTKDFVDLKPENVRAKIQAWLTKW